MRLVMRELPTFADYYRQLRDADAAFGACRVDDCGRMVMVVALARNTTPTPVTRVTGTPRGAPVPFFCAVRPV